MNSFILVALFAAVAAASAGPLPLSAHQETVLAGSSGTVATSNGATLANGHVGLHHAAPVVAASWGAAPAAHWGVAQAAPAWGVAGAAHWGVAHAGPVWGGHGAGLAGHGAHGWW